MNKEVIMNLLFLKMNMVIFIVNIPTATLDRLQTADGQPIWGLSMSEHDLIMLARDKVASS